MIKQFFIQFLDNNRIFTFSTFLFIYKYIKVYLSLNEIFSIPNCNNDELESIALFSIFILFQSGLALNQVFSSNPICSYDAIDFPPWFWVVDYCVLSGYLMIWIALAFKIAFSSLNMHDLASCYSIFSIVSSACVANIIATVFSSTSEICIDQLK